MRNVVDRRGQRERGYLPTNESNLFKFLQQKQAEYPWYPWYYCQFLPAPLTEIHQRNCQGEKSTARLSFQRLPDCLTARVAKVDAVFNLHAYQLKYSCRFPLLPAPSSQFALPFGRHPSVLSGAHLGHCRLDVRARRYHLAIKTAFRSLLIHGNQNGAKIEKVPT